MSKRKCFGEIGCFVSRFDLVLVNLFIWKVKALRELINCGV